MPMPYEEILKHFSYLTFFNLKNKINRRRWLRAATKCDAYSLNRGALRQQMGQSDWGGLVKDLISQGVCKPKKGHDAGDHPPITPMKAAESHQMDHDSWRLYEYIVKHFIGTVINLMKFILILISLFSFLSFLS